jgi:hypothetical protein
VKVSIRDKDRGYRDLIKTLRAAAQDASVRVGVFGEGKGAEQRDGGLTNAELMVIHEYGSPAAGIPERAPIRRTIDEKRESYVTGLIPRLMRALTDRKISISDALDLMGLQMSNDVKRTITTGEGVPPPLSPTTIARKGSSRPLVDTGRLLASITYAVVFGGKEQVK